MNHFILGKNYVKKIIYNKRLIDVQYMCLCHKSHITTVNNNPWTHTDRDGELIYNVDLSRQKWPQESIKSMLH